MGNLLLAAVLVACGARVVDDLVRGADGVDRVALDMAGFDGQAAALHMQTMPDEMMRLVCGGQDHLDWRFANETFLGRVDGIYQRLKGRVTARKRQERR